MTPAVRAVFEQAARLSPEDRGELAWELERLAPRRPMTEAETAELRRRLDDLDAGRAVLHPWEEVRDRLRAKIAAWAAEEAEAGRSWPEQPPSPAEPVPPDAAGPSADRSQPAVATGAAA